MALVGSGRRVYHTRLIQYTRAMSFHEPVKLQLAMQIVKPRCESRANEQWYRHVAEAIAKADHHELANVDDHRRNVGCAAFAQFYSSHVWAD